MFIYCNTVACTRPFNVYSHFIGCIHLLGNITSAWGSHNYHSSETTETVISRRSNGGSELRVAELNSSYSESTLFIR